MSQNRSHKPRTGNGWQAQGKKPGEVGLLRMMTGESTGGAGGGVARKQPKGWGVARVVNIFDGKGKSGGE